MVFLSSQDFRFTTETCIGTHTYVFRWPLSINSLLFLRLANAADAEGNICGIVNHRNETVVDMLDKPFVIYLINQEEEPPAKGTKRFVYGKCVSDCPKENDILCQNGVTASADPDGLQAQLLAGICFRAYASHPLANRCVPKDLKRGMFKGASKTIKSVKYMSRIRDKMYADINEEDFLTNVANDLYYSWRWIFIACAVAFGLAFIWLLLVEYLSWFMVWGTIASSFVLLAILTSYFWALSYHANLPFEATSNKMVNLFYLDFFKVFLIIFSFQHLRA